MEVATRLIVLGSLLLAGGTHAWLANGRPGLAPTIAVAFTVGGLSGRLMPAAGLASVLSTTFLAPALLFVAFGVSDYHTTAVWLAALAGVILTQISWSRWHIPDPWRLPFAAWALVIAVSWPIVAARELDFSLIAARTYDTTNAAFEAPPRLAAAWILIVSLSQLCGILWLDLLWQQFGRDAIRRVERVILIPLMLSALAGAVVSLYQSMVDLQWLNLPQWSHLGRAGGLMLDANTAGISAAIWGPAAVALTWRFEKPIWLGLVAYVVFGGAMFASGSRTALLTMSIGTAGLLVVGAQRMRIGPSRALAAGAIATAALVVTALAVAPGTGPGSPIRRVVDRLPSFDRDEVLRFRDELWIRFGYGKAANAITVEYPVTGVGVGAFHVVATDYLFRDGRLHPVPDNAQNWWRHQVAELGLVGALPAFWISVLTAAAIWGGVKRKTPAGLIVGAVLCGIGVASLLGMPTQHPATWLSFATLLFWLCALVPGTEPAATETRHRGALWLVVLAVAACVAIGQAIEARGSLRVVQRALRNQLPYHYGLSAPEGLSEYGEFRWVARQAVAVLPAQGRWLQLTIWAPHVDVATHSVTYSVAFNGRPPIVVQATNRDPKTFYAHVPDGRHVVLVEFRASRELHQDRALQVATAWPRTLPAGLPPEQVIRN